MGRAYARSLQQVDKELGTDMEKNMSLKDILQKIVDAGEPFWLTDGRGDWSATDLLSSLSEPRLSTKAFLQPGMYIAEINDGGYLGRVLFKVKAKASTS